MIKSIQMEREEGIEVCVIEFENERTTSCTLNTTDQPLSRDDDGLLGRAMAALGELERCVNPEKQASVQETNEAAEKAREVLAEWAARYPAT